MKTSLKITVLCLTSVVLFACNKSPVNQHPVKHSLEKDSSEESYVDRTSEILAKKYNVMFIGNSFTYYNDIDQVTESIGKSLGMDITCEKVAVGSHHLYQHAQSDDETGSVIETKIKANQYTHIILQEQSTYPVANYANFLQGATDLKTKIDANQNNCEISLYETWGFQSMADNYNKTILECEQSLFEAYNNCARTLGIKVNYVGKGFSKVYESYPSINLLYKDNKHPGFMGTYLASLIHLMSITGIDIRNATYQGKQGTSNSYGETYVNDENAAILKNVAYEIVRKYSSN